ncbi:MAG: hypothetical protein HY289_09715 [Planctomycetes bacterium]|nr:hypothetical protein [Planctomycetota bacterium]
MGWVVGGAVAATVVVFIGLVAWQIRRRHMQRWLPAYLRERHRFQPPRPDEEIHVILCICDHFEPKAGKASVETGRQRVARWVEQYPKQFGHFRDSDGRPPRYTFFFPIEEYEKEYLDALAGLCRAEFGEVEIHLHHDKDTPEGLRAKLLGFKDVLAGHGLLSRHRQTGALMYAFIHGNWALCNARLDNWHCGVDHEIPVLLETGCYADMTFPSAPSVTQPPIINRIYWACDRPDGPRSQDIALPEGSPIDRALLLVQGPLLLDWSRRKWGVMPAVENACLQTSQPPSLERLWLWLRARVQVPERPDWYFVKLHAHGGPEHDHETLLGGPMVKFHEDLAKLARDNPKFHVHYVTAREMVNLIKAAKAGFKGPVAEARDWELMSNLQAPP